MSSSTLAQVREKVGESAGQDVSWQSFGMVDDQEAALRDDVQKVRSHPLIPETVKVGGFVYDVDTGLLNQVV
jgi:carbonic anhydrase